MAAVLIACVWLGIGWWMGWGRLPMDNEPVPAQPPPATGWPAVVAVVPARDEAAVVAASVGSLLVQDYPGPFRVVLVDDGSSDGTAAVARALADPGGRLTVLPGAALAAGWTGKLWAVEQGVRAAESPAYLWLTDADIRHDADTLRTLVAIAERDGLALHSLMAKLNVETRAERWIAPAFVWFFHMLYPFGRVNDPRSRVAAAAGGCMLVRRDALAAAGGIAGIRGALIDDCALGRALKRVGPVRLTFTARSVSLRRYGWGELWDMIARSAYAQLGYSAALLAGTVVGLLVLFWGPVALGVVAGGWSVATVALATLAGLVGLFAGVAGLYGLSWWRGAALPVVALFYLGATLWSAVEYHRGRGGMWKGRAQARVRA